MFINKPILIRSEIESNVAINVVTVECIYKYKRDKSEYYSNSKFIIKFYTQSKQEFMWYYNTDEAGEKLFNFEYNKIMNMFEIKLTDND